MYLFPTYEENQILDGMLIPANNYCKKACNKNKCKAFYETILNKGENIYTCPHGYSVIVAKENNKGKIFCCLKIKDRYDKSKLANISKYTDDVFCPILSVATARSLIERDITAMQEKENFDSITHEIKNLDAQIKEHCETIFNDYNLDDNNQTLTGNEINNLYEVLRTIYVCSAIIHSRYAFLNYEKWTLSLANEQMFPISVYKKFDKMRRVFKNYKSKNVSIVLNGNSYSTMQGTSMFEMIPLLLIENAVKYSVQNGYVTVNFNENYQNIQVEISSNSPFCNENEIDRIYEKGFRGENAQKITTGNGLGLFFVKKLCNIFGIIIKSASDKNAIKKHSGIDYAPFTTTLIIPISKKQTERNT